MACQLLEYLTLGSEYVNHAMYLLKQHRRRSALAAGNVVLERLDAAKPKLLPVDSPLPLLKIV